MRQIKQNKKLLLNCVNHHEKLLIATMAAAITSFRSVSPAIAQTSVWTGTCVGGTSNDVATIQGLECMIANIFTVIITLIGLAAFLMFIIGSVRWLMSGGSTDGTKKAKDTLTYAVIGIVISLSAFIVLNLVAGFTGVNEIKEFIIPPSGP